MPARLLIKIPSRGRRAVLHHVLDLYAGLLHDPINTRILVTADADDVGMRNFHWSTTSDLVVDVVYGDRSSKVGAVNRDLPGAWEWDIVLLGSDDMWPQRKGLDEQIREDMARWWPHGDGCLWYSDGQQARLCTYPVMHRSYWERDRHIYHPDYKSYFADDEQTELAVIRGRMQRSSTVLLRHEHPSWSGRVMDDGLYRHNRLFKGADKGTYLKRRQAGFP